MIKLRSKALRAAGFIALALAVAHCGDSDVNVIGGGGEPDPGRFIGTTENGGVIEVVVGSIESITMVCEGETFGGDCDPPVQIGDNGNASGSCDGLDFDLTFTNNNEATIHDVSAGTDCDGEGSITRTGVTIPTRTTTPGGDGTPTPTQTPDATPTGTTPTVVQSPDAQACPEAARVEGMAGDEQVLDTGWTGAGHNARVISEGTLTVSLACSATTRPCGVCTVSGPIDNPNKGAGTIDNRRCSNNPSIRCTAAADCSSVGGACNYFFGGPLPLVAGGVQTCVHNEVTGSVSGTANVETGAFTSEVGLTSRVFTGISSSSPCPTCDGDPTNNDGVQGGTCTGGTRNGMDCDGTGDSVEFGTTSLDCPIAATSSAIGNLPIDLSGSSGVETLVIAANGPSCRAFGLTNRTCACDSCLNGDPCTSDDDCGGGAGTCGGLRCQGGSNNQDPCTIPGPSDPVCGGAPCGVPGEPTKPNPCNDLVCSPIGGSTREGECAAGPFGGRCEPTATSQSCAGDGDCPSGDTCVFGSSPCFLDNGEVGGEIVAQGQAGAPVNGVSNGIFATTFCVSPVGAPAINGAAGLPGAGRVELPIESREIVGGVVAGG